MRRLVAEIKAATAADLLGRHRPQQARRQGRLRRREARRLRRAQPRAGVRALRRLAAGPRARHRAEDRRAPGRAGPDDARGARRARPSSCSSSASGRTSGASCGRRARFEHDGEVGAARKVVSESRERTFDSDVSDPAQMREELARMAEELCAASPPTAAAGARSRSRCASTTSRPSPARTPSPSPRATPSWSARIALRLLREYAPPRPVRLLGVRVAGLQRAASDGAEPGPAASAAGGGGELGGPAGAARIGSSDDGRRVGEIELDYERSGAGRRCCLIMGMSGTALHWGEPFLEQLREDFEVIVYDHRGVGASSRLRRADHDRARWPRTPPGCSTRSRSTPRTCSASRWAA